MKKKEWKQTRPESDWVRLLEWLEEHASARRVSFWLSAGKRTGSMDRLPVDVQQK
jgi:hypothetical protein